MLENKTILIVSVVVPSLFLSLIIIITFAIIILLRRGKASEKKRKQSEPGENLSQHGVSNHAYFESGVFIIVLVVQNINRIFVPWLTNLQCMYRTL
jgi:NADH:ubiquinone oxidoreductase subunit 3 (subunit A)